jgi:hypothetical protein
MLLADGLYISGGALLIIAIIILVFIAIRR